jgi:small-conductance mechanosensitive channel
MQDFNDILNQLQTDLMAHIPNVLISLVVLVVGYLIARLIKLLIQRLFIFLGKLVKKRFNYLNFKQAGLFMGNAFFWLIIFSSLLIITDLLGLSILTKWFQSIIQYIPNILAAILIVFAAMMLGNLVSNLLVSVNDRTGLKNDSALVKIIRFLLLAVAVIIALDQIGIEISLLINIIDIVLAAILFGAALAFALGAQTSISNILACYYVRKMYKKGDEIQIQESRGKIVKIDTTTVVLQSDIGRIIIPAKEFSKSRSILIIKD